MELKIEGVVKVIMDTQTFDSGFSKREFVITTKEQYPQDIKLEAVKDKTAMLDSLSEGDDVEVSFNVRGNEYNGRYFINLQAWKIKGGESAGNSSPAAEDTSGLPPSDLEPMAEGEDDLPF